MRHLLLVCPKSTMESISLCFLRMLLLWHSAYHFPRGIYSSNSSLSSSILKFVYVNYRWFLFVGDICFPVMRMMMMMVWSNWFWIPAKTRLVILGTFVFRLWNFFRRFIFVLYLFVFSLFMAVLFSTIMIGFASQECTLRLPCWWSWRMESRA